jgi:hypothetical protein
MKHIAAGLLGFCLALLAVMWMGGGEWWIPAAGAAVAVVLLSWPEDDGPRGDLW